MNKESKISDELLVRYLLGEVSESEHTQVEKWIGESAANKNEFDTFRLIWDQSRNLAPAGNINENDAWARFKERTTQTSPKTITLPGRNNNLWLKVAAALLLLVGGTWLSFTLSKQANSISTAQNNQFIKVNQPAPVNNKTEVTLTKDTNKSIVAPVPDNPSAHEVKETTDRILAIARKDSKSNKPAVTKHTGKSSEFICNSTPYSFEICIKQSVKCKNDQPEAISTCNVLEPDQSGRLHYKAFDKIAKNCKATIDEIRITELTTGQTIVLNDHSTPTTAQNFFNHITGKKKGDVLAGMLHSDCDDNIDNCTLAFDSNFGNLILQ